VCGRYDFFLISKSIKRGMKRDGSTLERVKSQLGNQISNKERLKHTNVIINTNGDKEFVKRQIDRAFSLLMERTQ
jgi:dephospho-CoA kinase